jgi:nitroimidazol reductase NimA-like FMN-containing flavoprotein (pyridoxamine 5'-phosphate oxidase superfamily)
MSNSHGTVEVLDQARCVALLATVDIGRVVFTTRAMPAVRPVRFVVHDDAVWFPARDGEAWLAGVLDTVVAFSVDDMASDLAAGWFVTVLGRACEVRDPDVLDELAQLLPMRHGDSCVRVAIESVSGRRVTPPRQPCESAYS